jgi:hypothetical protein
MHRITKVELFEEIRREYEAGETIFGAGEEVPDTPAHCATFYNGPLSYQLRSL